MLRIALGWVLGVFVGWLLTEAICRGLGITDYAVIALIGIALGGIGANAGMITAIMTEK